MTEILVVDASLAVRMDLLAALEAAGFDAVGCATLAGARDALTAHSIALAILAVRMPDGDGIELLAELRADVRYADLPILMLSSAAEVKHRIRGLRMGATDYIGKPYDTRATIDRVRQLIAVPGAPGAPSAPGAPGTPDRLVLVIDDSPAFRDALTDALRRAGYATATAASGPEGLRTAAARRPVGIICASSLPETDGAAVIRRIRLDPALRTTPCILLTRSDEAAAAIEALDAGADAFVRKTSDVELILARLGAVLRVAHAEPAEVVSLLSPKRILAVDDSIDYLDGLADELRDAGYDVAHATSGEEAIALLAVQHVDCILLDHTMPGLSGIETCARIKAAPAVRDIPLIMLTAHESRDVMIEGLSAGADDFTVKSSGIDVLRARVQAQIRRKQFEAEHRSAREQLLRSEHAAAEARGARELAETRATLVEQLERSNRELAAANRELEAFSFSVSHDLRARVRAIEGFTHVLSEDAGERLIEDDRANLGRVLAATARMSELIDALLELSSISRGPLARTQVDLSAIASSVFDELRQREPARSVEIVVAPALRIQADEKLMRIMLDNLLGNAWKFTSRHPHPRVEVGAIGDLCERTFFIRDNGAGFDAAYVGRLFAPFQRLHSTSEFKGTGIGLATVQRILERHGGRIWAEGAVGQGATFYFTLPR